MADEKYKFTDDKYELTEEQKKQAEEDLKLTEEKLRRRAEGDLTIDHRGETEQDKAERRAEKRAELEEYRAEVRRNSKVTDEERARLKEERSRRAEEAREKIRKGPTETEIARDKVPLAAIDGQELDGVTQIGGTVTFVRNVDDFIEGGPKFGNCFYCDRPIKIHKGDPVRFGPVMMGPVCAGRAMAVTQARPGDADEEEVVASLKRDFEKVRGKMTADPDLHLQASKYAPTKEYHEGMRAYISEMLGRDIPADKEADLQQLNLNALNDFDSLGYAYQAGIVDNLIEGEVGLAHNLEVHENLIFDGMPDRAKKHWQDTLRFIVDGVPGCSRDNPQFTENFQSELTSQHKYNVKIGDTVDNLFEKAKKELLKSGVCSKEDVDVLEKVMKDASERLDAEECMNFGGWYQGKKGEEVFNKSHADEVMSENFLPERCTLNSVSKGKGSKDRSTPSMKRFLRVLSDKTEKGNVRDGDIATMAFAQYTKELLDNGKSGIVFKIKDGRIAEMKLVDKDEYVIPHNGVAAMDLLIKTYGKGKDGKYNIKNALNDGSKYHVLVGTGAVTCDEDKFPFDVGSATQNFSTIPATELFCVENGTGQGEHADIPVKTRRLCWMPNRQMDVHPLLQCGPIFGTNSRHGSSAANVSNEDTLKAFKEFSDFQEYESKAKTSKFYAAIEWHDPVNFITDLNRRVGGDPSLVAQYMKKAVNNRPKAGGAPFVNEFRRWMTEEDVAGILRGTGDRGEISMRFWAAYADMKRNSHNPRRRYGMGHDGAKDEVKEIRSEFGNDRTSYLVDARKDLFTNFYTLAQKWSYKEYISGQGFGDKVTWNVAERQAKKLWKGDLIQMEKNARDAAERAKAKNEKEGK